MKRVHFLLQASILVLLGSRAAAIAAPPQPTPPDDIAFERIDSRSGLSHSTVTALLQDKRGFLWVGTVDGLNRYDGYEFVVYRNAPSDTTSLSGNNVTALYESGDGRLWVGTLSGLNLFDPTTETAVRYRERGATDSDLRVIGIDPAPDSSFWITTGRRLVRFYPETGQAVTYASASPAWVRERTEPPSRPLPDSAFIIVVPGPGDEARILRYSDDKVEIFQVS